MITTTCAGLLAALKTAAAAAVLALPGGNCPTPVIASVNPPGVVTITSSDPTNPVVFTGPFKVANSSNLTFDKVAIKFSVADDPYWTGRMSNVKNVTISNSDIGGAGATMAEPGGFDIDVGDHVSIVNNTVHDIASTAFNLLQLTNTTVCGNDFHNWAKSAVGAAAMTNFTFCNNSVHDAFPIPGTHADGLQIFTAGQPTQSNGIVVTGNHMWVGEGWAFQGIFIQDDAMTNPILNVDVENNLLYGLMWDSLWLRNVTGKAVNNVMVSWPQRDIGATTDLSKPVTTAFTANLETWVAAAGTLTVTGNSAQSFSDQAGKYAAALPGNTTLAH